MSDLFRTGSVRYSSGLFSTSCTGNSDIVKRLNKLENGSKVAIRRTVSDFVIRAPGWVSKGIREHYGVDTAAINETVKSTKRGRSTIKVAGISVDGATIEYKGRTLTPIHFKMSPKVRPAGQQKKQIRIPGQAIAGAGDVAMIRPPRKYNVKATIIKGQRVNMPANTFIASGNGGFTLPFQRTGAGRMPIEAVRTLSVPQMIDGRAHETIQETISTNLEKRFQHYVEQAIK